MTTLEVIQSYYKAFNEKNWEKMLSYVHDDVIHDINQGESQVGKQRFAAFLAHMETCYDENLQDMVIMTHPGGKRAAAEFICEGTYLSTDSGLPEASKQTYRLLVGAFFEMSQDKITRITNYYNLNDWLNQIKAN